MMAPGPAGKRISPFLLFFPRVAREKVVDDLLLAPLGKPGKHHRMRMLLPIVFLSVPLSGQAAPKPEIGKPDEVVVYRSTTEAELKLEIFRPRDWKQGDRRPAILFFFGGGWTGGTTRQFHPQATRLAGLGMVACCADYRVSSRHKTSPFEAVKDSKAAMRWLWRNAREQGVDRERIVASGGSAGGHLAACTGLVRGHDEVKEGEPFFIPAAMVLFNPVIDTSKKGYGYNKLKERYRELSPVEHVHEQAVPTLVLVGSADTTTPVTGHKLFAERMQEKKRSCELVIYEAQKHGFFNARGDNENYWDTLGRMENFLRGLDLLPSPGR